MPSKKDNFYQHADEILDKMIKITGLSQTQFAENIFDIKGGNISGARKSKKIPDRWFEIMQEKYGVTKEALIQQAKNEYNAAHPHAQGFLEQPVQWVPFTPSGPQSTDSHEIPNSEMMYMTSVVLESSTVYRSALASNVRAFYQAVKGEQEMENLRDEIKKMREELAEMKEIMLAQAGTEKKRAGNDH